MASDGGEAAASAARDATANRPTAARALRVAGGAVCDTSPRLVHPRPRLLPDACVELAACAAALPGSRPCNQLDHVSILQITCPGRNVALGIVKVPRQEGALFSPARCFSKRRRQGASGGWQWAATRRRPPQKELVARLHITAL